MKILLFVFLILAIIFSAVIPVPAKAANEFSTSYEITYSVAEDGTTDVTENIKLKNLTDRFFPSSFSVTLPGNQISDIAASDNQGALPVETAEENGNTKVTVSFTNQQIIGLNKEYDWSLKFKDRSIAKNLGKIWNINLPKISQQTQVENLNLVLSVPSSFSDPDFISPKPSRITESGGKINLNFTKNELLASGISAIFGNSLNFEFETSYILSNNTLFPKYVNLVIPTSSTYQKSYIRNIDPRPENTTLDEMGNTLAIFKIDPHEDYEVKVQGYVQTFLKAQQKDILTESERTLFTSETEFITKNNPNIKNKLQEILTATPPDSDLEKARLIDKYVANFLQFDKSRIEKNDFVRFGAVTALNNPEKALAAEFVDLESALLRAAGIPTRQVIGFSLPVSGVKPYSYTNQNLHTWLEFFEPNLGWVIADPTWEHTTSGADFFNFNDLNHLSLAYSNGKDNFILPGNVTTNVFEGEISEQKGAELDIQVSREILSGFPSDGKIRINNLGKTPFPATELKIDTSKILLEFKDEQPVNSKTIYTPIIPPFGHLEYEFNLKTGAIWHSYQDAFQVKFAGADDTRVITVTPILSYKIFAIEIIGGIIIIALFYTLTLLIHYKSAKSHKEAEKN